MSATPKKRNGQKTPTEQTASAIYAFPDPGSDELLAPSRPHSQGRSTRKKGPRLTPEEREFILRAMFYIGAPREIKRAFFDLYGKELPYSAINYYKKNPRWKHAREKISKEYNSGLEDQYLASKKMQVERLTRLYEKAIEHEKIDEASDIIMKINKVVYGKYEAGMTFNFNSFEQTNNYAQMNLNDIKKERLRVLKEIEDVKIKMNDLDSSKKGAGKNAVRK